MSLRLGILRWTLETRHFQEAIEDQGQDPGGQAKGGWMILSHHTLYASAPDLKPRERFTLNPDLTDENSETQSGTADQRRSQLRAQVSLTPKPRP